jgi:protein-S-isoprenylcysteine O-methyltransferase Ste14
MSALENRIPPPLITTLIGLLMGASALFAPPFPSPTLPRLAAAAGLFLFGVLIAGGALAGFRRARTTINPVDIDQASALVTSGSYRLTRNPMYLGMAILLATLAIVLSSPWLLLGPLVFVLFITRFQIIPEERAMHARFGDDYAAYRARVRRWI